MTHRGLWRVSGWGTREVYRRHHRGYGYYLVWYVRPGQNLRWQAYPSSSRKGGELVTPLPSGKGMNLRLRRYKPVRVM